ncbi:MAG: bacteriophage abortive infection AbiH family protein [Roseburia sp.]|nr:bacteriophage abortive infection AbiH family protein [Roseburia sp.]
MNSPQLLILGNGFDAHCGLKSAYKDFFRSTIFDMAGERFGLKQLQVGVNGFWEELFLEYHKIDPKDDFKWCNVEEIIKNALWLIYYGESLESLSLENGLWREALYFIKDKRDLIDDKIYRDSPIVRYIFVRIVKLFESIKFEPYSIEEKLHLLSDQLFQGLNILEKRFCKYLKNQIINPHYENERNEEYIIKAVNLLARLTGFVHYKFNKIDDFITVESKKYLIDVFDNLSDVFILNFNYTALFDILEVESPCYYNNVHGKLCNNICSHGCDKSNIIFGIDDNLIQSQGTSFELRVFSKTYRKMLDSDKYITALPQNDGKELAIKFYGHSLSEADYSYFQSIFDYYDLYKNSNVSLTFYYSNGFENYDAVYKLISVYGKSLTNKEQGKNLIHKLLLENRLHISEIKE